MASDLEVSSLINIKYQPASPSYSFLGLSSISSLANALKLNQTSSPIIGLASAAQMAVFD